MGKIINKTKECYPNLPDAEYLIYEGDDVPPGVIISTNNVMINGRGELKVRPAKFDSGNNWGWSTKGGFYRNFSSPEEAIAGYHTFMSCLKKPKS